MNRRELFRRAGLAAVALGAAPFTACHGQLAARATSPAAAADEPAKKRILMFTRSQGFQHPVVTRGDAKLALAERIATEMGARRNIDVLCEKDGRVFESKEFPGFDGFLFETQGDLAAENSKDGAPPVSAAGKKALLDAVAAGKGFVGCHCASDTYHSAGEQWETQPRDKVDPYIAMLGGEFIRHGDQQDASMVLVHANFPGLKGVKEFTLKEEWYSLKNFAPDLHVILTQETQGMHNFDYERPPYPATWLRMHDKGRVFFTSMGHREDVWENAIFQHLLAVGLDWSLGKIDLETKPNLDAVAPKANELPKKK
jgi:type 1 glutamine amidotransferase